MLRNLNPMIGTYSIKNWKNKIKNFKNFKISKFFFNFVEFSWKTRKKCV